MPRFFKWTLLATAVFAVLAVVFVKVSRKAIDEFFYPKPGPMPAVVQTSTEQLLQDYEKALQASVPSLAAALRPGLSDAEITALETEGGFKLSDDLRSLYRWHDGIGTNGWPGIIPEHGFLPLDQLVAEHIALRSSMQSATLLQRAAMSVLAGHRKDWVEIMPDGAGDGFYYDPARRDEEGAIFYTFAEVGYYFYFPSFRNLIAANIECLEKKAYKPNEAGTELEGDFEMFSEIWKHYGAASPSMEE